jgi:hypothetical protein
LTVVPDFPLGPRHEERGPHPTPEGRIRIDSGLHYRSKAPDLQLLRRASFHDSGEAAAGKLPPPIDNFPKREGPWYI